MASPAIARWKVRQRAEGHIYDAACAVVFVSMCAFVLYFEGFGCSSVTVARNWLWCVYRPDSLPNRTGHALKTLRKGKALE